MRKTPFLLLGALALGAKAQALDFNFIPDGNIDPQALAAYQQAGSIWSSLFTDNVTINLKVGYRDLGANGPVGQTQSFSNSYAYSSYRTNLIADKKSALDNTATASLAAGNSYGFFTNATNVAPAGSTSSLNTALNTFHTATSTSVLLSRANAKAVGLIAGNDAGVDAEITFSSRFAFDLDRSDGVASNLFDFTGIAAHEIGHALGFSSGVDTLDFYFLLARQGQVGLQRDSFFASSHTGLDLFRYANYGSAAAPDNQRDWTLFDDSTPPFSGASFLSFDGGATRGPLMSSGANNFDFLDGNQASHWKNDAITGTYLGIMDPNGGPGDVLFTTPNDLNAFDAIGWDVRPAPVPEPATLAALSLGAAAFLRRRRRG